MQQHQDVLKIQKKLKITAASVLVIALVITSFSIFNLFFISSDQDQNEEPSAPAASQSSLEENNSKQSIPVEKYRDTSLSMGGNTFRLKYFTDGAYAATCAPDVTKPCEGLYTEDSDRPKAFLTIAPVDSKIAARICTGQEKPSFTFMDSDGVRKQACETGIEGRILYYNALLSLKGKNYQVIFTGETRKGVAYPNISAYKQDLQVIFPTITLDL